MNNYPLFSQLAVAGMLFFLGRQDVKYRRVTNGQALFSFFLCILATVLFGDFTWFNLGCWLLSSTVLYLLSCYQIIGAGDLKVIAASAFYGFMVWGLLFFLAFGGLLLLDRMAYPVYQKQGSAPLLWWWAWSFFGTVLIGLLTF